MNRIKRGLLLLGFATACVAGCASRNEDRPPSPASAPGAGADLAPSRNRIVQQMQDKLAEIDVKLATLKSNVQVRSAQLTTEGKAALGDAVAKLEEQRAAAQVAFEQARSGSADRWEQLKSRADQELTKIEGAYEAAAEKLRD